MSLKLSDNDRLLIKGSDSPAINPNSQWDQSYTFSDSDSDKGAPGSFSPRPSAPFPPKEESFSMGTPFGASKEPKRSFEDGLDLDLNFGNNGGFGGGMQFSPRPPGADYSAQIDTPPELAQIFNLVSSFQPQQIDVVPHLKPFLPELMPSIGAIDAFIKVPRPD